MAHTLNQQSIERVDPSWFTTAVEIENMAWLQPGDDYSYNGDAYGRYPYSIPKYSTPSVESRSMVIDPWDMTPQPPPTLNVPSRRAPTLKKAAGTRYPCSFTGCEADFSRRVDLKRHMRFVHKPNQYPLDCPYKWCGRTGCYGFPCKDQLTEHVREVHKAKDFSKSRRRISDFEQSITTPEEDLNLGKSIHSLVKGPDFSNLADQLDNKASGFTQTIEAPERDKRKITTTEQADQAEQAEQDKSQPAQKKRKRTSANIASTSLEGPEPLTSGFSHERAQAVTIVEDVAILAQHPLVREGKLIDLDLLINDVKLTTIPDTGAHINAIPLSTLQHIQWRIEESGGENSVIRLGNNTSAQGLFQVLLDCRLPNIYPGCSKSILAEFHVFRKLATGVAAIVGLKFLEATNVLTSNSSYLKEGINPPLHIPRCMSVGPILTSGLRLKIFLNRKCFLAMPDTGSEINLIVRACAVKSGFEIISLSGDEKRQVEFADGQIEPILEKVLVAVNAAGYGKTENRRMTPATRQSLGFGLKQPSAVLDDGQGSEPQVQTFYVLDNLTHEVILSQQLLHSMDVWNRHPSAFEIVPSQNSSRDELCTIFSRRVKKLVKDTSEFHSYTSLDL